MKKIYPALFCALVAGTAIAQPTISDSQFSPVTGSTFTGTNYDPSAVSPGSAGSGVTWNFASLTSTGAFSLTYLTPSSTPYAASFPGTNVAVSPGGGGYGYYQTNSTGYFNLGIATSTTTISYSDPEKLFSYPFTYNTNWTDNLAASFTSSGYPATRSGTTTGLVDGYGTLILPSGTYTNILRVKLHEVYSDVIDFSGTPFTYDYDITNYYWIKQNVHSPLMTHNTVTTTIGGGSPTTSYAGYILDGSFITGVDELQAESSIGLYPNPSTSRNLQVVFNSNKGGVSTIKVTDAAGNMVYTSNYTIFNGFNNLTLDLNNLQSGIYFVEFSSENLKTVKKLILQ